MRKESKESEEAKLRIARIIDTLRRQYPGAGDMEIAQHLGELATDNLGLRDSVLMAALDRG